MSSVMFLDSLDKKYTFRRSAAVFLIAMMLVASSPVPFVFADDGGDSGSSPSSSGGGSDSSGGSGDGSGGSEGDGGAGGTTGDGGGGGSGGAGGDTSSGDSGATGSGEGSDGASGEGDSSGAGSNGEGTENGEGGVDGENANQPNGEGTNEDTVIVTGNATSELEVVSEANTNETTATSGSGNGGGSGTSSTSPETFLETEADDVSGIGNPAASTTVENNNDGVLDTSGTSTAETGANEAEAPLGNALVDSGRAIAAANIINIVNTNIINSFGFFLLLSALFGNGSIDLRLLDFSSWLRAPTSVGEGVLPSDLEDGNRPCASSICGDSGAELTVTSSSTAAITNDVVVRASTGENSATAGDGSAIVSTGDAYASANIVNLANTNIIDSNYLLLALNNFGDFSGDIVFPGMDFFMQLFSQGMSTAANVTVSNNNTAEVNNNVDVGAETGGNAATSTGDAIIDTGNAIADANVLNQVNTNLFGGNSFYILLRVHGDWSGEIFGLPPGLSWAQTPAGIEIFSTGEGESGSAPSRYQSLTATNTNAATIDNNVSVYALTGDNKVSAEGGDALIETGNAYAAANIMNIANTNVIGQNLMLAVFNIFGNWSGNISFGRPDLWVGGRAESPSSPLVPGSPVTYHFAVTNFGDAEATDVVLDNEYVDGLLSFGEAGSTWEVGTLKPGETKELTYTAYVSENLPEGETPVELRTTARSRQTDNNPDDNTESLALIAFRQISRSGQGNTNRNETHAAALVITKEASVLETTASSTVDYTVIVNNYGNSAYNAKLVDVLVDEYGEEIARQSWDLGEIYEDEEITVTYTVVFDAKTKPGLYRNEAQVLAMDNRSNRNNAKYKSANSKVVSAEVRIIGNGLACEPLLTSYLKVGGNNDAEEVKDLQRFLRQYEGFTDLEVTGVFDQATVAAVRAFQKRYAGDILSPWGIFGASGYVYYTTQRKVNELYCDGARAFFLTSGQLAEIAAFKMKFENARVDETELPDTSEVGTNDANVDEELVKQPPREYNTAGASASIEKNLSNRFFKILSDTFGNLTSWVNDDNMLQSRR